MKRVPLTVVVLMASGISSPGQTPAGSDPFAEFTARVTAELRSKNPEAAEVFTRANQARDREEHAEAERLYREVRREEPTFFHATRRLCQAVLAQGRRAEASQIDTRPVDSVYMTPGTDGGGFALAVRRSLMTMAYSLAEGGAAE